MLGGKTAWKPTDLQQHWEVIGDSFLLWARNIEEPSLARMDNRRKCKFSFTIQSKSFASIYLGYGVKLTQDAFYPPSPEELELEGVDVVEFDEPNPRDPPDELEPDSDDQGKKPDDE